MASASTTRGLDCEATEDLLVRDRAPRSDELEHLRLLLSTFRDGSGQRLDKHGYQPGARDFERCTADICGGLAPENKGVFDVLVASVLRASFGISCKMAATQPSHHRCWLMELSNSLSKFAVALDKESVRDWTKEPAKAGRTIIDTVESWHRDLETKIEIDLPGSKYLLLTHDSRWQEFELVCFDRDILLRRHPATDVNWKAEGRDPKRPSSIAGYIDTERGQHRLWQCFLNSGGQLKMYPPFGWEEWRTGPFQLEQPPIQSLADKASNYWPDRWASQVRT